MKTMISTLFLLASLIPAVQAKIIQQNDEFAIETKKGVAPIFMVNKLIRENSISRIKVYGNGNVHLLSFAKNGESEMLYSVDEKGFIYSIKPFSSYTVSKVEADGMFQFEEKPGIKYKITSSGFFLH